MIPLLPSLGGTGSARDGQFAQAWSGRASTLFGVLLVLLTPLATLAVLGEPRYPEGEELAFLGSAYGLYAQAVLTSGSGVLSSLADGRALVPAASPAPLYPAFLAGMMAVDHSFLQATECILRHRNGLLTSPCVPDYGAVLWVQAGFLSIALLVIFSAGWVLTRNVWTSFLASGLAAFSSTYADLAGFFGPDVMAVPLLSLACLLLVLAARYGGAGRWLACGLVIGCLPLVLASSRFVLAVVLFLVFCSWLFGRPQIAGIPPGEWLKRSWRGALLATFSLLLGYLVVVGPWMGRNLALFGEAAVTKGMQVHTLEPRLAYNRMNGGEWAVAFIYWLPDFGDSLAERLFEPGLHRRLDIGAPDGFYRRGREIVEYDVELAGVPPLRPRADYLLEQELVGNFWKHVFVTLPLTWRGLFVAKYWSLVTFVALAIVMAVAVRRRWDSFLLFATPPCGLLLINAFVSVNLPQQNFGMIAPSALAMAIAMTWICFAVRRRLTAAVPKHEDVRENGRAQLTADPSDGQRQSNAHRKAS